MRAVANRGPIRGACVPGRCSPFTSSVVGNYLLLMELDLRKLNHFVAVAEELNFTRAAERLAIGQQALSASIRRLEAELEVFLLVRSTRQVELTAAGAALLDESRALLGASRAALTRVRRAAGVETSSLRVGHTPAITREMVAEFTRAWGVRSSEYRLVIRSHWFDEIPVKVAAGELDVGLAWIHRSAGSEGLMSTIEGSSLI